MVASIIILDHSGQTSCTFFSENIEKFTPLIQGSIYRISGCSIQPPRRDFVGGGQMELMAGKDSEFLLMANQPDFPLHKLKFTSFAEVYSASQQPDALQYTFDVLGIIIDSSPPVEIMTKSGQLTKKMDIVVVDQSSYAFKVSLWGEINLPENLSTMPHQGQCNVIALSKVRISNFESSLSLTTTFVGAIFLNPHWPEVAHLKSWYSSKGHALIDDQKIIFTMQKISTHPFAHLHDINLIKYQMEQGQGLSPQFFQAKAYIAGIRRDPAIPPWYTACPNINCRRKKVTYDETSQSYVCDLCQQQVQPKLCYCMGMTIGDETAHILLQCFDQEATVSYLFSLFNLDDIPFITPF
jgi:hypothetical protein